jgi:hypothetical protein
MPYQPRPGSPLPRRRSTLFADRSRERSSNQQEVHDRVVAGAGYKSDLVVEDSRDDACRAVGRRSHDTSASGVFLVDCQHPQRHPVHCGEGVRYIAERAGVRGDPLIHLACPPPYLETARKYSSCGAISPAGSYPAGPGRALSVCCLQVFEPRSDTPPGPR